MLTFLRKIRKSLIDSGSNRRYILYAIGEITLVVIGILIALQIDGLNQDRINRAFEKEYLERFKVDVERDSSLIVMIENFLVRKEKALLAVREYLDDPHTMMTDSVMLNITRSISIGTDLPNVRLTGTYQEMISSGHLRLLRNEELRNMITNYYNFWNHYYHRIEKKQSDYPSIVLQVVDREGILADNPLHQGKALEEVLSEFEIENEFKLNFMKEVNYMAFTQLRILEIKDRIARLKQAISDELKML